MKSQTKGTFVPVLGFIDSVLRSNPEVPKKYGALNMTAARAPLIMRHPDVKDNTVLFSAQHVLPRFNTSQLYLRGVACEVSVLLRKPA